MELYLHHKASPYVRKVLLCALELGASLEERVVALADREALDAYAAINPNRRFPALRDGALVLWESDAILRHLARIHDPAWLGSTRVSAALVDQWLAWTLAHLNPAMLGLQNARLGFLPRPLRDEATLIGDCARALAVLEGALAVRPYVAGEAITIADLALAAAFTYEREAALLDPRFSAVARWLDTIRARRSWVETEAMKRAALAAFGIDLQRVAR
ncbi:MAG: glutathione S-transferase family protein [Nannocystaceae bacterium]|nr:glutathione S-transferase family protein [Myxococcales bacterium]